MLDADCPVFSPAFARLDKDDTRRFTLDDISGMFPRVEMELVILEKSAGLNFPKSA